jgi:hypothetical protein
LRAALKLSSSVLTELCKESLSVCTEYVSKARNEGRGEEGQKRQEKEEENQLKEEIDSPTDENSQQLRDHILSSGVSIVVDYQ